jgi:hypothetical protein
MMNGARVRSLFLATVMLLAACGGGRTLQNGSSETMLEVRNNSTLDMNIYAISDSGARERIGTVTSLSDARFRLPTRLTNLIDLRLAADPVGSNRTAFSDRVTVVPGDVIVLEIPATVGFY